VFVKITACTAQGYDLGGLPGDLVRTGAAKAVKEGQNALAQAAASAAAMNDASRSAACTPGDV
jgi:hypothetical protein